MSDVDDFLNALHDEADTALGVKSMVCEGETFNVVWNDHRTGSDGVAGGIEPQVDATAVAQAADVTSPAAMRNKRCTVGGVEFRVLEVAIGDVAVTFSLCSPEESR
jgi:hypothetical protein